MATDRTNQPADQRALHGSVRRLLEALARRRPLCLVFEDIHWADDALLDLIEFIASRAKEVPLLLLAQTRPGLMEKRPTWGRGGRAFTSAILILSRVGEASVQREGSVAGSVGELRIRRGKVDLVREGGWLKLER